MCCGISPRRALGGGLNVLSMCNVALVRQCAVAVISLGNNENYTGILHCVVILLSMHVHACVLAESQKGLPVSPSVYY